MRKTITFKIEGYKRQFIVRELTVGEIISLMQGETLKGQDVESLKTLFIDTLLPMCTDITLDELREFAPSDIKLVWEQFKEMNKVFFEVAQRMGLNEFIGDMRKAAIADFGNLLVALPSVDISTS